MPPTTLDAGLVVVEEFPVAQRAWTDRASTLATSFHDILVG
jgi:hypothetical protein